MKHKIEIAPNLAIYIDGERVIGSKPYGLFLTTVMTVSDDDLKRLADRCLEVISDCKTESNSEKPNNCEHITEDGVTCAKYPACDDCLDNPLNKVKGSERLVKGSEQTEPTGYNLSPVDKDINVRSKDEPQTNADQHVQHVGSVEPMQTEGNE